MAVTQYPDRRLAPTIVQSMEDPEACAREGEHVSRGLQAMAGAHKRACPGKAEARNISGVGQHPDVSAGGEFDERKASWCE